ncbi:hypothetical protein Ga0074115_1571, partial [endosymbiont of Ridgeia piscesae]
LHYIFPFLITLFFYRSHGKQYTLPILSERLIATGKFREKFTRLIGIRGKIAMQG